jgi:hypothetical protein
MAPITASFITQVEDAICAEVLRLCGSGGEAYADPVYLQLKTARRGRVAQGFDVKDEELPAFLIEYIFCDEREPGGQTMGGDYKHVWNGAVVLPLTLANMGFTTRPTDEEFYQAVEASADVITRRVHRALRGFAPDVVDTVYHEASSTLETGLFRFVTRQLDQHAYQVQVLYELILPTEDTFSY